MADFSFLSDTDDSAVEDLLSQAMDGAVLDQVAAINCSGITDSDLPTHLETRFRKLKSFPAPPKKPITGRNCSLSSSSFNSRHHSVRSESPKTRVENESRNPLGSKSGSDSLSDDEMEDPNPVKKKGSKTNPTLKNSVGSKTDESDSLSDDETKNPVQKKGFNSNPKLRNSVGSKTKESESLSDDETKNPVQKKGFSLNPKLGSGRSVSPSSKSSTGNENLSPLKKNPGGKLSSKSKFRTGSFPALSSPSHSWSSSMESDPSPPPQRIGCLWCSPKRDLRKKNREIDDWGKVDELLSDLNTFSAKEQRKVLKKAMEEQKKISREAGKIVKLAKQASARMDASGLEFELSDNESLK